MDPILDQFDQLPRLFRPRTTDECFALVLADKLAEGGSAQDYTQLCAGVPRPRLAAAFQRTLRSGQQASANQFLEELDRSSFDYDEDETKLLAVKTERRSIAVAGFIGERLGFTRILHLSSDPDRAKAGAVGFINRLVNEFRPDSAAIESSDDPTTQRADLRRVIVGAFRQQMLPVWEIPKAQLLRAFGSPPLRYRDELRDIAGHLWPVLPNWGTKSQERDAAMLGLHVQLRRLFMPHQLTQPT